MLKKKINKKKILKNQTVSPANKQLFITAQQHLQHGRITQAEVAYRTIIDTSPKLSDGHMALGNLRWKQGHYTAAYESFQKATELNPFRADAFLSLGAALWMLENTNAAIECYKTCIELQPDNAFAYNNLGGAYYKLADAVSAENSFKQAIKLNPDFPDAYKNLANTYYEQGKVDQARNYYLKSYELGKSDGIKIRMATTIPMIMTSVEEINNNRQQLEINIDNLLDEKLLVNDPVTEIGHANFFLAYHGYNDRDIQSKLAKLYIHACPKLAYISPHCSELKNDNNNKIKVAFISRYLHNHSIGKTSRGIIANLSRDDFHVVAIFLGQPNDEISHSIYKEADESVVLPNHFETAINIISNLKLDILYYQDTGMDPFTFFLSFTRLAPVQCSSFGHPETTGIPNIDYYISTDLWEPEDGESHYSERLVKLHDIASVAYYYKPEIPSYLKPRSYFDLADDENIYICPQTLFKLHPDMDEIFSKILHNDQNARIILIEGKYPHWSEILKQRFQETIPEVINKIRFLKQQKGEDFINLLAVSDVMLDTTNFCGFNTTIEGFAVGTPVVTFPGKFMRGRHTQAFYRKLGFMDCVAKSVDDYVKIAINIANDAEHRNRISSKILASVDGLWQEEKVIREFEQFFLKAHKSVIAQT